MRQNTTGLRGLPGSDSVQPVPRGANPGTLVTVLSGANLLVLWGSTPHGVDIKG
jgi:hypothetical protein